MSFFDKVKSGVLSPSRNIAAKISWCFVIMGLVLLTALFFVMRNTLNRQEEELMLSKEESDIQYIEDYISPGGSWSVRDGVLYKGFTALGKGTEDSAYHYPFLEINRKTGTNLYVAIHVDFADPEVLARARANNPDHSNYLRVAGSTKDADGNSIAGTFVPKEISDILEKKGSVCNKVDVQGVAIFSYYKNLLDREGNVIGYIVAGRDVKELTDRAGAANRRTLGIVSVIMGFILLGVLVIIRRFISGMKITRDYLKQIGTGTFPEEPLKVDTHDEIREMADIINEMTVSLKERQRIGAELSVAKDLQANILPTHFPAFPGRTEFDVFATMTPAKEVGGDFYDYFLLDEKHLAVIVADVSGKGVAAAFFMAIAKTIIRSYTSMGLKPEDVFSRANRALCQGNSACLFVTAWLGVLNLESGLLTYVNAGHNPPLLRHAGGGFEYLVSKPNFVLAGFEKVKYTQHEVRIEPGAKLYLYTDGVTEATNIEKKLYGEDRLRDYLNKHKDEEDLVKILSGVKGDIDDFVAGAEQFDDITMLMLHYKQRMESDGFQERTFCGVVDEIQPAMNFVEEVLIKAGCSVSIQMRMVMVAEELFTNICRYAYDEIGDVTLAVKVVQDIVTIRLIDSGRPFDPTKHSEQVSPEKFDRPDLDGLGIFLVKGLVDTMDYRYDSGRNILTVTKKK